MLMKPLMGQGQDSMNIKDTIFHFYFILKLFSMANIKHKTENTENR